MTLTTVFTAKGSAKKAKKEAEETKDGFTSDNETDVAVKSEDTDG